MYRLNYEQFDRDNQYIGNDLGAVMKEGKTVFKTWSPLATGVYLNLYLDGEGKSRLESLPMERLDHGVWYVEILRDLDGVFYTYTFEFDHKTRHETIDIYAKPAESTETLVRWWISRPPTLRAGTRSRSLSAEMLATQWCMSATSGIFLRTVHQALLLSIEESMWLLPIRVRNIRA